MKSLFESMYGQYNLMFEDYFMEMLIATSPQMVHPLSAILAFSLQQFDQYLRINALMLTSNASIEEGLSVQA